MAQSIASAILVGAPGSLGVNALSLRRGVVENDKHQNVARLRCRIAPKGPDLTGNATGVFRNDLAEGIALNGNLLSSFDLFIQFDQKFDESALGREDRKSAITDKDARNLSRSGPSDRR